MIRLDRLQAFRAFAELKSFTRAARRLHLSQPALHVQIKQLAEEVGAPLYRRDGRGVALTREGRELAAFAREIEDRTARFLDDLHGRAPTRPLVLCAGEASTRYLLAPALRELLDAGHKLRLLVGDAARAVEAVRSGEAHAAFTVTDGAPEGLVRTPAARVGTVVLVPAAHPLARRKRLRARDLADRALIVPPPQRPHRARIDRALREVPWTVATEVQGWELMARLVAVGLGLALVNAFVEPPEGVVAIPFEGLDPVDYAVLTREDGPRFAALDAFVEGIRRGE